LRATDRRTGPVKHEWRCTRCGKLLGVLQDARLHIRFARGHEYIVGFPATSVCRSCRTLNELAVQQEARVATPHTENEVRN
jgi:phage FluMu protein Com